MSFDLTMWGNFSGSPSLSLKGKDSSTRKKLTKTPTSSPTKKPYAPMLSRANTTRTPSSSSDNMSPSPDNDDGSNFSLGNYSMAASAELPHLSRPSTARTSGSRTGNSTPRASLSTRSSFEKAYMPSPALPTLTANNKSTPNFTRSTSVSSERPTPSTSSMQPPAIPAGRRVHPKINTHSLKRAHTGEIPSSRYIQNFPKRTPTPTTAPDSTRSNSAGYFPPFRGTQGSTRVPASRAASVTSSRQPSPTRPLPPLPVGAYPSDAWKPLRLTPKKASPQASEGSEKTARAGAVGGNVGADIEHIGLGIALDFDERGRPLRAIRDSNSSNDSYEGSVLQIKSRKEGFERPLTVYKNEQATNSQSSLRITSSAAEEGHIDIADRTPVPAGIDNLVFIDDFLEENYRGQAETFARTSSRSSSMRSLSASLSRSTLDPSPGARFTPAASRSATLGVRATTAYETPTRPGIESFASSQRSASLGNINSLPRENVNKFRTRNRTLQQSPSGRLPATGSPSPKSYGHRVFTAPAKSSPLAKDQSRNLPSFRGRFYFTAEENLAIQDAVVQKQPSCTNHNNCTDCRELEYSFLENKAMPTSMPPEERQKIINNNRSLRNIKNELENLAENGAIADEVYDQIMKILPSESSLNASSRSAAVSPAPVAPVNAFSNMHLNNASPPPPAYTTPNAPPSLPSRQATKPEIARATALYRYTEPEDCNFEVGDEISVFEYMNADWWFGKNTRTGKEGVFPVTYVQIQTNPAPSVHGVYGNEKANNSYGAYGNEKVNAYPGVQAQGPPPPGPSNPYNSSVPPMAVAEQPAGNKPPGKGGEMGKKFGKKLGNAAIFGAGATIGGNIVNSIF
ncbi:[PSI+] inducibility protein [Lachnellula suecica]|uniref:[PSI+] inducibility protein n=1 Tax=Lachnellula suecica TaxID=602035 RepID=A0A8T9C405_9HELO|nr:[PSI+] inducibility protein [Lachnellula suecica]